MLIQTEVRLPAFVDALPSPLAFVARHARLEGEAGLRLDFASLNLSARSFRVTTPPGALTLELLLEDVEGRILRGQAFEASRARLTLENGFAVDTDFDLLEWTLVVETDPQGPVVHQGRSLV